MSKWMIPRHKPKKEPMWCKADRNHGRKFTQKRENRLELQDKEKRRDIAELACIARYAPPTASRNATIRLGQCARKTKLSEESAWKCVRSAALERGVTIYAYKCKWCGNYHFTSHPLPGVEYPIKAEPIKL